MRVLCFGLLVLLLGVASIRPSDPSEGHTALHDVLAVSSGGKLSLGRPSNETRLLQQSLADVRTKLAKHKPKPEGSLQRRVINAASQIEVRSNAVNGTRKRHSFLRRDPAGPRTPDQIQPVSVAIYYAVLYGLLAIAYFIVFRSADVLKVNASRVLRQVAFAYWRYPRLSNIVSCSVLYCLGDGLLSQDWDELGWWFSIFGASATFHALWSKWFYEWLDGYVGEADGWWSTWKKFVTMQFLYVIVYLPPGILLWHISLVWWRRISIEASSACLPSALAASLYDLEVGFAVAGEQLAKSFEFSAIFWPLSGLFNWSIVQTWSPGFRPTWEAVVVLFWNVYVGMEGGNSGALGDPPAVGPILADRAAIMAQNVQPTLDCSKESVPALLEMLKALLYYIWTWIEWLGQQLYNLYDYIKTKIQELLQYLWEQLKLCLWLLKCLTYRKTWEGWCVICFLVRWAYIFVFKGWAGVCTITWKLWCLPFEMFDKVKWYCGLFFVPQLFSYDCPCPTGEFDESWEQGVIWTGDYLKAGPELVLTCPAD